jgi:Group II intron, maturase-specific domain
MSATRMKRVVHCPLPPGDQDSGRSCDRGASMRKKLRPNSRRLSSSWRVLARASAASHRRTGWSRNTHSRHLHWRGPTRREYRGGAVHCPACAAPPEAESSTRESQFGGFNPAVSPAALKTMRAAIRDLNLRRQTQLSLQDIAQKLNPLLRGWIGYYGRYAPSALSPLAAIR